MRHYSIRETLEIATIKAPVATETTPVRKVLTMAALYEVMQEVHGQAESSLFGIEFTECASRDTTQTTLYPYSTTLVKPIKSTHQES